MPGEGKTDGILSYHKLNYSMPMRVKGLLCLAKYKPKRILREISGVMKPGMNAILGPSGSGKTSLLDILAGRKETGDLDGLVLLDGAPLPKDFRCLSGYVVQDDIVMGTLTVRENLNFSASLRLPGSTTQQEKRAKVDAVLADLAIAHVADTKVGNEFIRGVSGGERKRTNIGMELIISPPVLFLDEPTTGLDAFTAESVMRLLQELSRKGKTIIFSIHQPRYSVFMLFDTVTLLGNGQTIYHAPSSEALPYFEQLGFICDDQDNPADFFLDVVQGVIATEDYEKDLSLAVKYQSSDFARSSQQELDAIYDRYCVYNSGSDTRPHGHPTSIVYQAYVLSKREIMDMIRNPTPAAVQSLVYIVLALFFGGIYWDISDNPTHAVQDRVGAVFFMIMNIVFLNLAAVGIFIETRHLFKHEIVSGYYSTLPYFISKTTIDLIVFRTFPVILFCAISYYMIDFHDSFSKFAFFVLVLVLTSMSTAGYAYMFSAMVELQELATLYLAFLFVIMAVIDVFT
jgi:ATP-binding cassette subfamily G (WHITE) protein 2